MLDFKQYIRQLVLDAGITLDGVEVSRPPQENMGDFALPCFAINIEGLKNPNEKAKYIQDKLTLDPKVIAETIVAGPYLNFVVNRQLLIDETINAVFSEGERYGSSYIGDGQKLLIEHTSINPNASPHIGRSRNSIIGDFLVNLYRLEGFDVERHYFVNDIGKQISMLLVGVEQLGNIDSITFKDVLKLYVEINELSKTDKDIENKVFYYLHELENGNEQVRAKFKKITDICERGQQDIFKKLNISWDIFTHESDYVFDNSTNKILDDLQKTGKLHSDENGRLYVDLTGYDIPTKSPVLVLTREDHTSLYPLRDIAYTIYKIKRNSQHNILVLGEDQEVYSQQIAATLDILGYPAPKLVSYSFVLLNGGRMATREGKVVLLEDFIDTAKQKIIEVFEAKGNPISESQVADMAAACIKYNMLNVNRKRIVNFNLDEATDFQGNSAIYLLYNYARINSILDKANYKHSKSTKLVFNNEIEYSIIKHLYAFRDAISTAYNTQESVVVANYLHTLAQKFSKYYEQVNILNEPDEDIKKSRLALLDAISTVLKNGMTVLGIKTVQKF